MSDAKRTFAAFLAAAMLAAAPALADAQQGSFFVEGRGGVGLGLGDTGELTTPGPTFGADVGYWLDDRLALTVGGDVTFLSGEDTDPDQGVLVDVPDVRLWH